MTAHQLATELLKGPDLPVVINGWSSDEGFSFEVDESYEDDLSFNSPQPQPKDSLGWNLSRPCIRLSYSKNPEP